MTKNRKPVRLKKEDSFENETSPAMLIDSEAMTEAEIDEEESAIDKMLAGDDEAFDKLEY